MRVGRSEARAVRERSMICLFFSPHGNVNGFFSPIQDSRIFPRMMKEKGGLELGVF